jgi:hypothetical protein
MKVIFDRSAFHPGRFEKLEASRLLPLTRKNKITVYFLTSFASFGRKSEASQNIINLSPLEPPVF